MKLSPARRVFLVITILVSIVGAASFAVGRHFFSIDIRGIGFFLLFVLLGLELADRVTMKRDLEIARDIQRWLAPEQPPEAPGMDLAFSTRPANTVGGDFYDAFYRDPERKRLLLAVADVAGKSVPAALLMATFQACLHSVSEDCEDVVKLAERLNHFACSRSLEGRRFTTAFLAELNLETFSLDYVNAGHNAPVVQRADGRQERLERGGLPFGIDPAARYPSTRIQLDRDDLLLIFTDGLVEAVNAGAAEYGDSRMLETLAALKGRSGAETIRGMVQSVDTFAAGARQYDDITFLAARRV
jgi:sigma-B regulation protein RsbU (phosphoserine phosphatase)